MIKDAHSQWNVESVGLEGEGLVPFRIQVPMDGGAAMLEGTTFELDIRITATWGGVKVHNSDDLQF